MSKGNDVLASVFLIGGIVLIYYAHRFPEKDDKSKTLTSNLLLSIGVILGLIGLAIVFI